MSDPRLSVGSQLSAPTIELNPATDHGPLQRLGSQQSPSRLSSSGSLSMEEPPTTHHVRDLQPGDQQEVRLSSPRTYKSRDLQMDTESTARLEKTIGSRVKKAEKLKTDKVASRKDTKSRFDKFLKEFKSVIKNVGKTGKAVGDSAKGIREAVVTGDSARLGGFNSSDAQKAFNKTAISNDGTSGMLSDMAAVTGGIGAVTQLVETGADIYLFYGKTEKMKVDHETVQKFAKSVTDLHTAKEELIKLNAPYDRQLRSLDRDIAAAEDAGIDPITIDVLKDKRNDIVAERDSHTQELQDRVKDLTKKVQDTAIGSKLASGDMDKFLDDLNTEGAKLYKSVGDGLKAGIDLARLFVASGTVAAEGLKAASGTVGAVIGPLTFVLNARDGIKDVEDNLAALKLKHKAGDAIQQKQINQDDAELLAIAERIRLKQKKQSVDKGLSATKNAFGAVGGLASGFAGAATIAAMATGAAVGVAAIATPIGWALAGAAALAAVGYGIYKLARHINSSGIKAALQQSIQTLGKIDDGNTKLGSIRDGLSKKEISSIDRAATKMVAALKAQGIEKSPDDITVAQLRDYSMKKLLARDTGIATTSLYHRFKDEVAAALAPKTASEITSRDMQLYLDAEGLHPSVGSAASLIAKLGITLSPDDALLLLRTGSDGESNALKFLGKKLKLI